MTSTFLPNERTTLIATTFFVTLGSLVGAGCMAALLHRQPQHAELFLRIVLGVLFVVVIPLWALGGLCIGVLTDSYAAAVAAKAAPRPGNAAPHSTSVTYQASDVAAICGTFFGFLLLSTFCGLLWYVKRLSIPGNGSGTKSVFFVVSVVVIPLLTMSAVTIGTLFDAYLASM